MAGFKKIYQKVVAPLFSGASTTSNMVRVNTVAQLEAAVAAQKAGQVIEIEPGDYTLTESLSIPLAATGGVLKGLGLVTITGAADADEAILVDPAVATATFEYTFQNIDSIKGGADKIGLHILNTTVAKKVIVYMKDAHVEDNGTGKGLVIVNSDGSNAIRLYAEGNGASWDSVDITPKDAGDRFYFWGIDFSEDIVVAAVDVAATFKWTNCMVQHAGVTGGHANNVAYSIHSVSITGTTIAAVDASEFPDAFNPTIV
jgi:hypothetical protein